MLYDSYFSTELHDENKKTRLHGFGAGEQRI